ncbi:RNA polymerase II-associated protein 3, partial [Cladochytrium tenue]
AAVADILSWEKDIKAKDAVARQPAGQKPGISSNADTNPQPPVREQELQKIDTGDQRKLSAQQERDQEEVMSAAARQADREDAEKLKRVEEALTEKEKGNLFFKKGDFKKAISCYTKSIGLDPTSAVVPVNRAMAYLKLKE